MAIELRTVRTTERDGRAWLDADEAALFSAWRQAHNKPDIPPAMLPRLGMVAVVDCVDSAAAWLYLDNSVGVGFVEWLVTRPGLGVGESIAALGAVVEGLKLYAQDLGYGLLLGHCAAPIARVASRELGWLDTGVDHRALFLPISKPETALV